MTSAFEILCVTSFLAASVVWFVSATKRKSGFAVSAFTAASIFYNYFVDKEIMYE